MKGTHRPAPAAIFTFGFMFLLCTASHGAQAATSSQISAEVERPAFAIMMHAADESFAESGSIESNSTIKFTPSAPGPAEASPLSQL